jgi:hypothetical protein
VCIINIDAVHTGEPRQPWALIEEALAQREHTRPGRKTRREQRARWKRLTKSRRTPDRIGIADS